MSDVPSPRTPDQPPIDPIADVHASWAASGAEAAATPPGLSAFPFAPDPSRAHAREADLRDDALLATLRAGRRELAAQYEIDEDSLASARRCLNLDGPGGGIPGAVQARLAGVLQSTVQIAAEGHMTNCRRLDSCRICDALRRGLAAVLIVDQHLHPEDAQR